MAGLPAKLNYLRRLQVIQAIPNAIGALCLNEVGQAQLAARPSIIPALFTIFTSERHLKVLLDKENAVLMGTGIDELIRHHPSLKTPVFDAILACLSKIEDLGNAYEPPAHARQWYQLLPVPSTSGGDVTMKDANDEPVERGAEAQAEPPILSSSIEDTSLKRHDNHLVNFIDVLGRVSAFFLKHSGHNLILYLH
jgi:E3 ubiquitin-protein ligase HUWE1